MTSKSISSWFGLVCILLLTIESVSAQSGVSTTAPLCYTTPAGLAAFQQTQPSCPGLYCGRSLDSSNCNVVSNSCGPCASGSRTDGYVCVPCTETLSVYDILYLVFWLILVGLSHLLALFASPKTREQSVVLLASNVIEVSVAAILALLCCKPYGSLSLTVCPEVVISDWYTVLFNPNTYSGHLHCDYEAVYPRWSVVLLFLLFCIFMVVLLRLPLSIKLCNNAGRPSIYGALYYLPVYALLNVIFSGPLYYIFPYVTLVAACVMNSYALHKQGFKIFHDFDHIALFCIRYMLMAFGLVSICFFAELSVIPILLTTLLAPAGPTVLQCALMIFWSSRS